MTNANSALQLKTRVTPLERIAPRVQATPQPDIAANPVFHAIMQEESDPEQKLSAFVSTMLQSKSKLETRQTLKDFVAVREWLSNVSKTMDVAAMSAEDSQSMGRVRKIINAMGDHLMEVDKSISPLIAKTDSFYAVTKTGDLYGIFEKQAKNNEQLASIDSQHKDIVNQVNSIARALKDLSSEIETESKNKNWLTGKIKASSQVIIDDANTTISEKQNQLKELAAKTQELEKSKSEIDASTPEDFKAFLEMLSMKPEDLEAQQEAAKTAAIAFVKDSDEQLADLSKDFGDMMDRKNTIQDNTTKLVEVFGVLTDGLKQVIEKLKDQRTQLITIPAGESLAEKSIRENKIADLDEYINVLTSSQVTTNTGYADLGIKAMDIRASKERFNKIMELAKGIQIEGVAKSASGLQTALHAINQAMIENAAIGAQQIVNSLGKVTDNIQQKEWMRLSTQTENIKKRLKETIDRSSEFNETFAQGIEVARENMKGIQQIMNELHDTVKVSLEKGKEYGGIAAETEENVKPTTRTQSTDMGLGGFKSV